MTLPRELLAAIAADPDASGPRLAAADWFAAHGDPDRAEFIRLQVEVGEALAPNPIPGGDALDTDFGYGYRREAAAARDRLDLLPKIAREHQLLAANGERWFPIPNKRLPYRDGFPTELDLTLAEFLERPVVAALAPGGKVRLSDLAPRLPRPKPVPQPAGAPFDVESFVKAAVAGPKFADATPGATALAACPGLADIARLDLSLSELTADQLAILLASPHLGELRSLDLLGCKIGPTGAAALAGCAKLKRTQALALSGCKIGADGAAALARSPYLAALTSLDVNENALGDTGAAALAESPTFANLTALLLGWNDLTPAGMERIGHSPHLTHLKRLYLSMNLGLGDDGLEALVKSPLATRLESLSLGVCGLSAVGLRQLKHPAVANLRSLDVDGEKSGQYRLDARAIGGNPHLAGLEELWLKGYRMGDYALGGLSDGPGAANLHTLCLDNCGIGAVGIRIFAESEKFRTLRTLHLRKNPLGPDGAAALAESPHLHGLRKVDVQECDLGEDGMLALIRAPWMRRMVEFRFGWNKLTDRFAVELAKQPFLANFIDLDLGLNRIGDEGLIALANSPYLSGLRKLSIGSNRIGDAGCRALAASPYLGNLEHLIMTDNPATTAAGRMPLWERFDRPGECRFVFGFRKRIEDKNGDPEPKQPGDGFRDNHDDEDEDDLDDE